MLERAFNPSYLSRTNLSTGKGLRRRGVDSANFENVRKIPAVGKMRGGVGAVKADLNSIIDEDEERRGRRTKKTA